VTDSPNVELVRSIYAAWERGDFRSTDWADRSIEWVIADGPELAAYTGLAGMAEGWRRFVGEWAEFHATVEHYRQLDDERVLVLVHRSGRAKSSGAEVQANAADVWHVREGKVTRFIAYWDRERALADLGLAPEGDAP
jgi:uncharacterized protein